MLRLDRRITIRTSSAGKDRFGRARDPVNTDRQVWAMRMDKTADRIVEEAGVIGERKRVYRIRYRADILALLEADATARVVDENGLVLSIENVVTATDQGALAERRRFVELEVSGATD